MIPPKFLLSTPLFSFVECILSVLLFALSTGLVSGMNGIIRLISSKLNRPKANPRLAKLEEEIREIRRQMDSLSPAADFAHYFKLERLANKLGEESRKIGAGTRKISPKHSPALAIGLRATALFCSLALAFHSSVDTRLFAICSDHFYPFNFLLDFPSSLALIFQRDEQNFGLQSVGLFSFAIISLFTLNVWKNARIEMSKKFE